jgi:hypothetical protein
LNEQDSRDWHGFIVLKHLEQHLACATILPGGFEMKAKSISSEKKVRTSDKKVRSSSDMTWAEMDRLLERRVKGDSKLLKVLAKL